MAKRDYLAEIAGVRGRNRHNLAVAELHLRLSRLESAFRSREKVDAEFLKYFPVAMVACIEAYSRSQIREFIDRGSPFAERAARFDTATFKFDLTLLRALGAKVLTAGELVSHVLPINGLEDVNNHISILTGQDFLEQLKIVHDRWAVEVKKEPFEPIIGDPSDVFDGVKRCFDLRHIVAHEFASAARIEASEIERCYKAALTFLRAMAEYCNNALYPGAPLTQTDMNIEAAEDFRRCDAELDSLVGEFLSLLEPKRQAEFEGVQKNWRAFREAVASFDSKPYQGGTIQSLIYSSSLEKTTQSRIAEMKSELERLRRYPSG